MHCLKFNRNTLKCYLSSRLKTRPINPFRSVTSTVSDLKVGDIIHGYKLERIDFIEELNIKPYYLRHLATGAEHLHIRKDDDSNNVFGVSLRTTPKNSTGVAHILEHLALCGSKNYGVRDPFFKMLTRSLATCMNAFTGPDHTLYPFSTQNKKDFENLLSVYLDAVFFPRLRQADFRQEAWRLEHEKPDDNETPITIRGVVFNEMKGVFSSSSSIYSRQLLNNLLPDTTYGHESGGDPLVIPDLSYDDLKKFHKIHYHPSNSRFFTYGDFPLEDHLRLIDEKALSKFSENSLVREQSRVNEQSFWKGPRLVKIACPEDPVSPQPDKQTTTSISYLLPTKITDLDEILSLQILSSLLLSGPNSPFYKNLLESGLGSDYSPSTGIETCTKQPFFSVGLRDIHPDDIEKVHKIIDETLSEVAKTGFPQERIDALLHNIELEVKHIGDNAGLRTFMNISSLWTHDGDVINSMKINSLVDSFKNALKNDTKYWEKLIRKFFIDNKHKLILNMSPGKNYEQLMTAKEKEVLESKISRLDEVGKQALLYEGMELLKMQQAKEDTSVLPCLKPSEDIPRELRLVTKLDLNDFQGVNIQLCPQQTNELIYFRAIIDVGKHIELGNLNDYLPLFCNVATKLGAGQLSRHKFSQQIELATSGLDVSLLINPSLSKFDQFKTEIMLSSKCLQRNTGNMFHLWSQLYKEIHFQENKDYLTQLIKSSAADLSSGLAYRGNYYAVKRASRSLSNLGSLEERLSGLSHVARMKDMSASEPIDSVISKLQQIAKIVFNPHNMKCAINTEPEIMPSTLDKLKNFISSTQSNHDSREIDLSENSSVEVGFEATKVEDIKFPFATHFVAKSIVTVPKLHTDFPKLVIMSKLITSRYLLPEIREKGGAYGAKLEQSASGILSFSSYRDPNTTDTIRVFDYTPLWMKSSDIISEHDVEESKLAVFQSVDKPITPGRRGLDYFIFGITDDMKREYREKLLDVTLQDVKAAADYLNNVTVGTHII